MKKLIPLCFILLAAVACNKNKNNRTSGVCYCDFANGQSQEYDLTHLDRAKQIDTCNNHNKNAGNFGGKCELK